MSNLIEIYLDKHISEENIKNLFSECFNNGLLGGSKVKDERKKIDIGIRYFYGNLRTEILVYWPRLEDISFGSFNLARECASRFQVRVFYNDMFLLENSGIYGAVIDKNDKGYLYSKKLHSEPLSRGINSKEISRDLWKKGRRKVTLDFNKLPPEEQTTVKFNRMMTMWGKDAKKRYCDFKQNARIVPGLIVIAKKFFDNDEDAGRHIIYTYSSESGECFYFDYFDTIHLPDTDSWEKYCDAREEGKPVLICYDCQQPGRHIMCMADDLLEEEEKLLFDSFIDYRKYLTTRLWELIRFDLAGGNMTNVINKLESCMECSWHAFPDTWYVLGRLLIEKGDMVKAGRYLFFTENPSEIEKAAIEAFIRSVGDDPVLIAKKIIPKKNRRIKYWKPVKKELFHLLNRAENKVGKVPGFLLGFKRHFDCTGYTIGLGEEHPVEESDHSFMLCHDIDYESLMNNELIHLIYESDPFIATSAFSELSDRNVKDLPAIALEIVVHKIHDQYFQAEAIGYLYQQEREYVFDFIMNNIFTCDIRLVYELAEEAGYDLTIFENKRGNKIVSLLLQRVKQLTSAEYDKEKNILDYFLKRFDNK